MEKEKNIITKVNQYLNENIYIVLRQKEDNMKKITNI